MQYQYCHTLLCSLDSIAQDKQTDIRNSGDVIPHVSVGLPGHVVKKAVVTWSAITANAATL